MRKPTSTNLTFNLSDKGFRQEGSRNFDGHIIRCLFPSRSSRAVGSRQSASREASLPAVAGEPWPGYSQPYLPPTTHYLVRSAYPTGAESPLNWLETKTFWYGCSMFDGARLIFEFHHSLKVIIKKCSDIEKNVIFQEIVGTMH